MNTAMKRSRFPSRTKNVVVLTAVLSVLSLQGCTEVQRETAMEQIIDKVLEKTAKHPTPPPPDPGQQGQQTPPSQYPPGQGYLCGQPGYSPCPQQPPSQYPPSQPPVSSYPPPPPPRPPVVVAPPPPPPVGPPVATVPPPPGIKVLPGIKVAPGIKVLPASPPAKVPAPIIRDHRNLLVK
jgi:hypothetical protein